MNVISAYATEGNACGTEISWLCEKGFLNFALLRQQWQKSSNYARAKYNFPFQTHNNIKNSHSKHFYRIDVRAFKIICCLSGIIWNFN